jgi:phospholipid/cholesterol/gamma-HCH transport system substrate-binding protein
MFVLVAGTSGCGWHGLNTLPLPGTQGTGADSFVIQAQMPDVNNIQPNSRVRVADVTVGHVTRIERQGWHALLTMQLNGDVDLPANTSATIGTTSLLGSQHIELAPPRNTPPQGKLRDGSLIPLSHAGAFPTTEQTLAALSLVLNGGGLGQVQDITEALSTALRARSSTGFCAANLPTSRFRLSAAASEMCEAWSGSWTSSPATSTPRRATSSRPPRA